MIRPRGVSTRSRPAPFVATLLVGGLLLVPGGLTAQIGALAAAAAAAGGGGGSEGSEGSYALAGAPVFAESGLVLNQGWALGGFGVSTGTSSDVPDGFGGTVSAELSVNTLSMGAFAAVGERVMLGAVLVPYSAAELTAGQFTNSASGLGDLTLLGKAALTQGPRTRLAATASVRLPVGDEEVASASTTLSVGVGASHVLDARTSVHGGLALGFTSTDSDTPGAEDGSTTGVGFNGAVVRSVSETLWLSGELLGNSAGGAWSVLLAPGLRYRAGEGLFVDVGLATGLLSSDDVEPLDYGLAAGVTWVPRR
jgi:hypothetical protein